MWKKSKSPPWFFLTLLFVLFGSVEVDSARILTITFTSSKSHKIVFEPLLEKLAERGHHITDVSPIKSSKGERKNMKMVHTYDMEVETKDVLPQNFFEVKEKLSAAGIFKYLGNAFLIHGEWMTTGCRKSLALPQVRALLDQKFDLVIFAPLFNDCIYGLVHQLNTTSILMQQTAVFPWYSGSFGAPTLPSFVPLVFYGFPEEMTFMERVGNFLGTLYYQLVHRYIYIPKMEQTYRDLISPQLPGIKEIEANASLMLINSHISFATPRPLMPDLVEVGGMHLKPAKKLPKDLDDYCNESGENGAGFIYFSMGTVLQGSTMPEKYRLLFLNVFSKLKQRVIWKWETETMPNLPKNVKLGKWLPQQDILAHPNIRLFITHGGFGSTTEALNEGVPLLGLPMFGDQISNMAQAVNFGLGLALEIPELTEEILLNAINRILNEPTFSQTAKKRKEIFRDQVNNPLDRAVYWVEYVLRHGGATHMRSAGRKLNFFQYYSLDVIAVILTVLIGFLLLDFLVIRAVLRKIFGGKGKTSKSTKRKKTQ